MSSKHWKSMGKLILPVFFVLIFPIHVVFANVNAETLTEKTENFLVENQAEIAGMTTILLEDDLVQQWLEGYADIDKGILVDEDTVFEWGSISKVLIWISVFQLVEAGMVNLDTDIGTYLPGDFQVKRTYSEPITNICTRKPRS